MIRMLALAAMIALLPGAAAPDFRIVPVEQIHWVALPETLQSPGLT